jgi:hypothetical protein
MCVVCVVCVRGRAVRVSAITLPILLSVMHFTVLVSHTLQADEGAEGWGGIFGGMAELCAGLASGASGDSKPVKALFTETRMSPLLEKACGTSEGRRAVAVVLGRLRQMS